MFTLNPITKYRKAYTELRAKFNSLNSRFRALSAENSRLTLELEKARADIVEITSDYNEVCRVCDAKEISVQKYKEQVAKAMKTLREQNREMNRRKTMYEAVLHDIGRFMSDDRCRVCDRRGCADCANGSHFKWRGEEMTDDAHTA